MPITSITTPDKKEVKVPRPAVQAGHLGRRRRRRQRPPPERRRDGTVRGCGKLRPARPPARPGTTEKHNQVWFVGYTPQLATAVWLGNLKPASKSGKLYSLNGKCFGEYGCIRQVFGGTVSAPMWAKIMRAASEGMPVKQFKAPSEAVRKGKYEALPNVIGYGVDEAKARLSEAGFSSFVAGQVSSSVPAGTVAYTDPPGSALPGSKIGLYVSTGQVQRTFQQPDPAAEPGTVEARAQAPKPTKP